MHPKGQTQNLSTGCRTSWPLDYSARLLIPWTDLREASNCYLICDSGHLMTEEIAGDLERLKEISGLKWILDMFNMITSWDVRLGAKRRM